VLRCHRGADVVERAGGGEVGAKRPDRAHERVDVAVGQPWHEVETGAVDDPGRRGAQLADRSVVPDVDDLAVVDRHRGRFGRRGVEGADAGADDGERRGWGHRELPLNWLCWGGNGTRRTLLTVAWSGAR
jgi:hypothetical protein